MEEKTKVFWPFVIVITHMPKKMRAYRVGIGTLLSLSTQFYTEDGGHVLFSIGLWKLEIALMFTVWGASHA